ncbi:glycoside hydrolase family 5 protein [Bacillus sp. USDA818B3_A]|uniref:glycoside hydrolase family 5 protein n=1 Tax=Bacillus sp. USDA818B3_A TaxID=2698834 RepID=UPI001368311E|nr:glycoside hydrolase family 5 protein [Bacillus sp. USDA818B3_A]
MTFIKRNNKSLYYGDEPILLRGFGLGGWLLPEGYMWKLYTKCDRPRRMEKLIEELCGKEYAERFWEAYFSSYITKFDIELIASRGYNSVRLPLNSRFLYEYQDDQYVWKEAGFRHIDRLIEWCKKYGLYIILDMHGAPGGQTGTNIDDSANDKPELFLDRQNQLDLLALWKEIASRYVNETIIAGYDLLNEPLPKWFSEYNELVLPLYKELINEIRSVDKNHLIILEGVHWSTDFSIFDGLKPEELDDNLMLQFHKYWSPPDEESLVYFLDYRNQVNLPIFMGEGGENNLMWYSAIFPLYDRLDISWSFWSYKKMDCTNSPVTFSIPEGWNKLTEYIDGEIELSQQDATHLFDQFLLSIQTPMMNESVFNSLRLQVPIRLHCEFYTHYSNILTRQKGAELRCNEPVSIQFENGKTGVPDYARYGGEPEPKEENVIVEIREGESLIYEFVTDKSHKDIQFSIFVRGDGVLELSCETFTCLLNVKGEWSTIQSPSFRNLDSNRYSLSLLCMKGEVQLDFIDINIVEESQYLS